MKFILKVCYAIIFPCIVYSQASQTYNKPSIRSFDTQQYRSKDKVDSDKSSIIAYHKNIEDVETRIKSAEKETTIRPISLQLVFHLLHSDDIELSRKQLQNQLDALNRDFNNKSLIRNHPNDPDNIYYALAKNAQINFTIKSESITDNDLRSVPSKQWKKWDDMKQTSSGGIKPEQPQHFINIWITHLPEGMSSYASSIYRDINSVNDGIVLDARYFTQDSNNAYHQGKTLTHLMGNYLGLHDLWTYDRHCQDDYVADTPIHNSSNYGKPGHTHITTCPEENYAPEMLMNFMDNADDEIQTMFTAGQVQRMHTVINILRQGLLNSNN